MATLTAENLRTEIAKVEHEAREMHAAADRERDAMVAAGVNLLTDQDNFNKLDALYKAADQKASDVAEMRSRLETIGGWSGGRPAALPPGDRGRMNERRERLGHRLTQSEAYRAMRDAGAFQSEAGFASAMIRGFDKPVELMSRDEFSTLMEVLRYGATTVTGGGATSAGPFIQNDLVPGFVAYARKQPTIASIVGQGQTDSDVVEYVSQSAPTNNAAETAEDTAASESAYAFATNTTNVREITHFVPVTLRAMADEGQIRTIIENQLAVDVIDRLDSEVYSGNGSGQNLTGITAASGIGTFVLGAYTRLDAVHRAITTVRTAAGVMAEPDYIVMHPNDWQKVRLEKDSNGQYLLGPAGMNGDRQLWGIEVIVSTVATEGTILIGAFRTSATLWLREGLSVTSGLDGNDFTKRRVSLLAAMRIAFAVTRAGGFCTVTSF